MIEQPFCAVLEPNPPLSSRATCILLGALSVLCLVFGMAFWLAGAWPVSGLLGLELLAFAAAFSICRRRACIREQVRIDSRGLTLETHDDHGVARHWRFQGHWATASAECGTAGGSRLVVRQQGRSLIFGRFLSHDENISLAAAINRAIERFRVKSWRS